MAPMAAPPHISIVPLEDALFTKTPVARTTCRITCRVCERPAEVPLDAPARLCPLCTEDLDATLRHIRDRINRTFWALDAAWHRLEADIAHADEATQVRWHAYQDAKTAGDPRAVETEAAVRRGVQGALADLVRGYLAWQTAQRVHVDITTWADAALEEIRQIAPNVIERYRTLQHDITSDRVWESLR